jgi:hypothetical protein
MALVIADRVQETTTTTGTGTVTLLGAVSGFQSFAAIGNGNATYYTIAGGTEWEVGIGTYTSSGTTLSRTTVLDSSNAGSLVNFSAGTKNVFVTYPADRSINLDDTGNLAQAVTAGLGTVRVPGEMMYRLNADYTALTQTAAQSALGVGVTVVGSTVYQFEALYALNKTGGGVGVLSTLFGGTATLNNIGYVATRYFDTAAFTTVNTPPASNNFVAVATAYTSMTSSASTTTYHILQLRGTVSVNAGGTFIPQIQTSTGAAGTLLVKAGSFFKISPLGASGANTSIGTWA